MNIFPVIFHLHWNALLSFLVDILCKTEKEPFLKKLLNIFSMMSSAKSNFKISTFLILHIDLRYASTW